MHAPNVINFENPRSIGPHGDFHVGHQTWAPSKLAQENEGVGPSLLFSMPSLHMHVCMQTFTTADSADCMRSCSYGRPLHVLAAWLRCPWLGNMQV